MKFNHSPVDFKCIILNRYIHNIGFLVINDDRIKSELINNFKADLSELCEQHHTARKYLLDKHPSVIKIKIS